MGMADFIVASYARNFLYNLDCPAQAISEGACADRLRETRKLKKYLELNAIATAPFKGAGQGDSTNN